MGIQIETALLANLWVLRCYLQGFNIVAGDHCIGTGAIGTCYVVVNHGGDNFEWREWALELNRFEFLAMHNHEGFKFD